MFTSKFSKRQSEPKKKLWRLISLTYLVSLYKITSQSGVKLLYKIIPIAQSGAT
jgi:hypothetical protein